MKKNKTLFVSLAISFVLMGYGVTLLAASSSAGQLSQDRVTIIDEGQTTRKQKEHGRLYNTYKGREKLIDKVAKEKGDIEVRMVTFPPFGGSVPSFDSNDSTDTFLRGISRDADAVVLGTIKDGTSHLTENGTFVFTDYDFLVEEVIKQDSTAEIQANSNITVTRPGGTIQLKGRIVRAKDVSFNSFEPERRYVLFLKRISSTGAYRAFRSGSFEMHNNKVSSLMKEKSSLVLQDRYTEASFITKVHNAVDFARQDGHSVAIRLY